MPVNLQQQKDEHPFNHILILKYLLPPGISSGQEIKPRFITRRLSASGPEPGPHTACRWLGLFEHSAEVSSATLSQYTFYASYHAPFLLRTASIFNKLNT